LADGVDLVDEDNRRRGFASLLEEVADARCTDADEHLHELRAARLKKGHPSLPGGGLGQERLAGARGPHQEYPLRNARAQPHEALRVLQKVDDLPQLRDRLVAAAHVLESDAYLLRAHNDGFALADSENPSGAAEPHPPVHRIPDGADHRERQYVPYEERTYRIGRSSDGVGHSGSIQLLDQGRILCGRDGHEGRPGVRSGPLCRVYQQPADLALIDRDLQNLAGPEPALELAVGDLHLPEQLWCQYELLKQPHGQQPDQEVTQQKAGLPPPPLLFLLSFLIVVFPFVSLAIHGELPSLWCARHSAGSPSMEHAMIGVYRGSVYAPRPEPTRARPPVRSTPAGRCDCDQVILEPAVGAEEAGQPRDLARAALMGVPAVGEERNRWQKEEQPQQGERAWGNSPQDYDYDANDEFVENGADSQGESVHGVIMQEGIAARVRGQQHHKWQDNRQQYLARIAQAGESPLALGRSVGFVDLEGLFAR